MDAADIPLSSGGPQLERAGAGDRGPARLPRGAGPRAVRAHGRAGRRGDAAARPRAAPQGHQDPE